jgi:transcriptional antiterminator RfaH
MPILHAEPSLYPVSLLDGACDGGASSELGVPPELDIDPTDVGADGSRIWHVIYTKSRQEKAVARELYRSQVPFYLPLVPKTSVRRGRRSTAHMPLFPGYLFLFGDEQDRLRALKTNRLSRILPVTEPLRLLHDLRQIRQLIDAGAPLTVEERLEPGDAVRVKAGPFAGIEGVVVVRRGRSRLLVEVAFLQKGASVEIEDYMLEPI